jgi:iron complex transport system substrate-binding protein
MENIAADVDDTWTSLGWETIVERDPEVIILVDAQWNTAEDKIARLESNPATAGMQAVESGSYLRLPFAASEAGVRNAEAVADLAEQYGDLGR